MPVNEVGKVRQSAVIMNYGSGAIVDFRVPSTGAAVSIVAGGLEQWTKKLNEAGGSSQDMKRLTEPRLAEKLKVSHFRLPPVCPDNPQEGDVVIPLVGARFPSWLQCPACNTVKPARKWGSEPGNPSRFCSPCSLKLTSDIKAYVVPVRFVVACRNGHLDDFPWSEWVHQNSQCRSKEFKLKSEGPGLAGLFLSCPKCKQRRSMEHIFTKEAHEGRGCKGDRPWLSDGREDCQQKPISMQRGASNLYFPIMESALVIPPWSEEVIRQLGYRWNDIVTAVSAEMRSNYIDAIWDKLVDDVGDIDIATFKILVEEKVVDSKAASSGNLRWDEYQQFMVASGRTVKSGDEFEVRVETPSTSIPHLANLQRVVSLREIRVLRSFTRIEPLPGNPPVKQQFLSHNRMGWLPAIDVRGEGIFIALEKSRLKKWELNRAVTNRAAEITTYSESRVLNPDNISEFKVSPELAARYLLLHSLAHILMKQLSLQCGYSSASLRERLYLGEGDKDMAGIMIYTATSDSDGTLGGLQRQGQSARFTPMFIEAIRSHEWCSSDPLCIKGLVAATESSTLAACHSCLLVPETSCEDFNRFLDRAMLIGTPEDRSIGFFTDLLSKGTK
ncbi:DUF1998 domain-containing protein [Shewanella benthica]|nr:DUF1998 domain-containing protein [Shewanella benthica]